MCAPNIGERYPDVAACRADLSSVKLGGALVHAGRIEVEIVRTSEERARALAKATSWSFVAVLYILVGATVLGGTIYGLYLLAQTIALVDPVLSFSFFVSALGMLISLFLLRRRTRQDAWEPPSPQWTSFRKGIRIDGRFYSFERNGKLYSGWVPKGFVPEDGYRVWCEPTNPNLHMFAVGSDELFDPSIEYHPE